MGEHMSGLKIQHDSILKINPYWACPWAPFMALVQK